MSIQQLDQSVNRFGTTKVGDFLNSHTSPDGTQLIDDPDIPTGTITITENGTDIDVAQYAKADVSVETYSTELNGMITRDILSVDIPSGITEVGAYAFYGTALQTATFPATVTTIGNYAFGNCTNISVLTMPQDLQVIGNGAFSGCANLATFVCDATKLTSLGNSAFEGCEDLTSTPIPIGEWANVPTKCFKGCTSLTVVTIPDNITTIKESAFEGCAGITDITVPNTLTTIEASAFKDCADLTEITLYGNIATIGENAFNGCTSLTTINYTGTQAQWEQITIGTGAIPQGVTINYEYTPE